MAEYFTDISELQRPDERKHSHPLTKRRTEIDLAASLWPKLQNFVLTESIWHSSEFFFAGNFSGFESFIDHLLGLGHQSLHTQLDTPGW